MTADHLRIPADRVPSPHAGLHRDGMCIGAEMFTWDSGPHFDTLDSDGRDAVNGFLRAHGIEPIVFIIGNKLTVRARCDGGLWLDTWRAVAGNEEGYMLCEFCPHCVRQEQVMVPLVAQIPHQLAAGAYVDPVLLDASGVNG